MPQIKQTTVAAATPKNLPPRQKALRSDLQKKKNELEKKGWEFHLDSEKSVWSGSKPGEIGGTDFHSLEKLLGFIEKRLIRSAIKEMAVESAATRGRMESAETSDEPEADENLEPQTRQIEYDFLQKIAATNSCGIIGDKGTIKKPFDFEGKKYVATSSTSSGLTGYTDAEAYEVIPEAQFKGETFSKYEKSLKTDKDRSRAYHRIRVKFGKENYVLSAPKIKFVLKKTPPSSLLSAEPPEGILETVPDERNLPKTVLESCRVKLTDAETLERNRSMTHAMNLRDAEIARFAVEREKHKANLKMIEADVQKYRTACDTRQEWRDLECVQDFDYQRGIVDVFRPDSGEKIRSRSMTSDELQKQLFRK